LLLIRRKRHLAAAGEQGKSRDGEEGARHGAWGMAA
jgi:hypothetical protein